MITFWILWGIDAIAALVAIVFFFIGITDGSVSSSNSGMWFLMLAAIAGILLGSLWLKAHDYLGLAKTLLSILAIPTALYGLFLLVVIFSKTRWN
ncbi:MAG: osmoprotectant transporter permease [Lewinellaceae bacterium]|nr:osmoprotectant transporter permease [Saprospiraceae bacterium]MCB9333979.1 osmoprotectant transporter permease [Lewinellaceae bacterium]